MTRVGAVRAALAAGVLGVCGCANPDSVLFVTDTSIGINVDQKPPTISVAYDRNEVVIEPRYENGALPPVISSIETGGSVFDPKIRQVYATGAAALKAAGVAGADGPPELSGDPTKKRMAFFGTTTTLGFKAGFSGDGYPDSLVFGYKRKEFSFIPLGSQTVDGKIVDVYPSVLASIEANTNIVDPRHTELTSQQFFATGRAAEALATNQKITDAFASIPANSAAAAGLSAEQRQAALAAGIADRKTQTDHLVAVLAVVAPNDVLDKAKLAALIDRANATGAAVSPGLKTVATAADLRGLLQDSPTITDRLFAVLP